MGEWKELLGFSVTAGIVTWLLNLIATTVKDRFARRDQARYLALCTALTLERFALDCASAISDAGDWNGSQGCVGAPLGVLPELKFTEGADWKLLDTELVEEILSLPNQIAIANANIDFCYSNAVEGDVVTEGEEQAGLCGYRAVLIANRLRKIYKLRLATGRINHWHYVDVLKTHHDEKQAYYETLANHKQ